MDGTVQMNLRAALGMKIGGRPKKGAEPPPPLDDCAYWRPADFRGWRQPGQVRFVRGSVQSKRGDLVQGPSGQALWEDGAPELRPQGSWRLSRRQLLQGVYPPCRGATQRDQLLPGLLPADGGQSA